MKRWLLALCLTACSFSSTEKQEQCRQFCEDGGGKYRHTSTTLGGDIVCECRLPTRFIPNAEVTP